MRRCPKCEKEYASDAKFCPVDGAPLDEQTAEPATDDGPTKVGEFLLGTRLGGGRTGEVFFATRDGDEDSCVVKVASADVFDRSSALKRAARELRQLAKVEHPAIARVLEHGRDDQDRLWVAMESFEGRSVEQEVLSEGPMDPVRAARIIGAVGAGLADAAKLGVIHRDLAPKNILVGADNTVKLINFTIPLPARNGVAGTPEFVAPEQVEGRPLDQRSSIYSLGAVHYFLLTGRAPHEGAPEDVHKAHGSETPDPPSTHAKQVSKELDEIVMTALSADAGKRHLTLRQFVTLLEELAVQSTTQPLGRAGSATLQDEELGEAPTLPEESVVKEMAAAKDAAAAQEKPLAKTMLGYGALDLSKLPATPESVAVASDETEAKSLEHETSKKPAERKTDISEAPVEVADEKPAAASADLAPPLGTNPGVAVSEAAPAGAAPAIAPAPETIKEPVPAALLEARNAEAGSQPTADAPPSTGFSNRGTGKKRGKKNRKGHQRDQNKFRETLWFKKGELDEAAARAAAEAAKRGEGDVHDKADHMPIEERYADDGSLSDADRERLSLRTGQTMMMGDDAVAQALKQRAAEVSEKELVRELHGNRRLYIGIGVGVLALIGLAIALLV